jgi:RNA polymerase sigma factor (sigma-70 family)
MRDSLTDSELLARFAQGDDQSLDGLMRRHLDLVYATARRQVGCEADAQDIVQTVFVLFARRAPHLRSKVSVAGWLFRTTRFCCLNFRKLAARRRKHETEKAKMSRENPAAEPTVEAASLLDAGLSRLHEGERATILLHYLEERTFAEAAQALGISENAARKRAYRGIEKLKAYFDQRGYKTIAIPELLAVQTAFKAPAALAGLVITAAHQPAATVGTGTLAHAAMRLIFWGKVKTAASIALIVITLSAGAMAIVQAERPAPVVVPALAAADALAPSTQPSRLATTNEANDPNHPNVSGFIANANLPTELPVVLWKYKSEAGLTDSIVAGGNVIFADATGRVFSLDVEDGLEAWRYQHGDRISVKPAADNDQVYFGSNTGITALRRNSGKLAWNFTIKEGAVEATPLPVGDRVYAAGYDGNAYALDRATGAVMWKHDFASDAPPDQPHFSSKDARFGSIVARPRGSACDGDVFVQCVFDQSRVIAVDCATGQRRWSFQATGWVESGPTIAGDHVFVVSQDKFLYCLDRVTGKLIWKFRAPTWLASRVAVHDGIVFLAAHHGCLYQIDEQSGKKLRAFQSTDDADRKSLTYSFPIVTNQSAYFATGDGQLYAIGIAKNNLLWQFGPSEGSELFSDPSTDGRRIFVTSRQGSNKTGEHAVIAVGAKP